jgi:hypothetical protein
VSDGQMEISGPVLVYNLQDEQLQAESRGESVHMTVATSALPKDSGLPKNAPLPKKGGGTPSGQSPPPPQGHR